MHAAGWEMSQATQSWEHHACNSSRQVTCVETTPEAQNGQPGMRVAGAEDGLLDGMHGAS